MPVALSVLTPLAGLLAVLLIVFRMADQPGPDELRAVHGGAWLGLAAAALIVVGGWRSLRVERIPGAPRRPGRIAARAAALTRGKSQSFLP